MAKAPWLVYLFVALVLQTQISLGGIPLNLVVVVIYAFTLRCCFFRSSFSLPVNPEIQAAVFGASVGLIEDIITGSLLGTGVLSKGLIGFLLAVFCSDLLFRWTPLLGGILLFIFTMLDGTFTLGLMALFTESAFSSRDAFLTIVVQSAINALSGFAIKPSAEA